MQTVDDALAIIHHHAKPLPPRAVGLSEALGLELAEPVRMDIDSPPFARALLDGYAARAVDALAGAQLKIVGRVDAGSAAGDGIRLGQGQCVAINTGAPVPPGADVVVPVEHTAGIPGHPDFVLFTKAGAAGGGIQPKAGDAKAGDEVLRAGVRLTPADLAVAAAAGQARVVVKDPKPVVGLLVTGDELVEIETVPGPAQIRNTNQTLLRGLMKLYRLPVLDLGTARDDSGAIGSAIDKALVTADVLIVTGGMSMGTKDLVPKLLADRGVAIHIAKVKVKPGKPFIFGTLEREGRQRYVIGLPGNPVSAFVCFVRFVVPLLVKLDPALPGPKRAIEQAYVDSDLPANGEREFYQPCLITTRGAPVAVTPLAWRGSADLFTLARADALIIHPANAPARPAQSLVDILHLKA